MAPAHNAADETPEKIATMSSTTSHSQRCSDCAATWCSVRSVRTEGSSLVRYARVAPER